MTTTTTVRPPFRSAHRCARCDQARSSIPTRGGQPAFCSTCSAWEELLEDVSRYTADLWAADAVVSDLAATTSQQAITEMVEALVFENKLSDHLSEVFARAFLFDADETSAVIEHGLAVLLITHPAVDEPLVLVARSQNGIDFQAVDDQPAKVFLLLVSPPQSPAEQLRLTAGAARLLVDYARRSGIS